MIPSQECYRTAQGSTNLKEQISQLALFNGKSSLSKSNALEEVTDK